MFKTWSSDVQNMVNDLVTLMHLVEHYPRAVCLDGGLHACGQYEVLRLPRKS